MSNTVELNRNAYFPTLTEKIRLFFGLLMMILGLYFGFVSTGVGESLGFLSVMTSPFVMITDK
jgi:hypothetical protein